MFLRNDGTKQYLNEMDVDNKRIIKKQMNVVSELTIEIIQEKLVFDTSNSSNHKSIKPREIWREQLHCRTIVTHLPVPAASSSTVPFA